MNKRMYSTEIFGAGFALEHASNETYKWQSTGSYYFYPEHLRELAAWLQQVADEVENSQPSSSYELDEDCYFPAAVDVEWFREPGTGDPHYRPFSCAGIEAFKSFERSPLYPLFYGFLDKQPSNWPHLTFQEIPAPEPV